MAFSVQVISSSFWGITVETMTWDHAILAFDLWLESEERSPHTRESYRKDLRAFGRWFWCVYEVQPEVRGIIETELREWKQSMIAKNHKPNSINRRLRTMTSFLRWAIDEKMAIPIKMPKTEKEQEHRPHWLTISEEHRLVRAIEKAVHQKDRPFRDFVIVVLLLRTGIRVGELAALSWSDVTVSPRAGTLVVRRGKGAKRRLVPLDIISRDALTQHGYELNRGKESPVINGPHGRLTTRSIENVIFGLRWSAKLPELKCHTLRHTCLRRLIESGAKIQEAARIAGHTSIDTTNLYILPNEADLQAAVDRRAAAQYGESPELAPEMDGRKRKKHGTGES
jgi:integrase/recombinase XerC